MKSWRSTSTNKVISHKSTIFREEYSQKSLNKFGRTYTISCKWKKQTSPSCTNFAHPFPFSSRLVVLQQCQSQSSRWETSPVHWSPSFHSLSCSWSMVSVLPKTFSDISIQLQCLLLKNVLHAHTHLHVRAHNLSSNYNLIPIWVILIITHSQVQNQINWTQRLQV